MKRDQRDPEILGKALIEMRKTYPDMSAAKRADLLDKLSSHNLPNVNGNGK